MSDNEILDESEAAIEALFDDFKNASFPSGWEAAILDATSVAPVIRLAPEEAAAPTLPTPPRVHAPASFWTRHRLTAARVAAAAVLLAGAGLLVRLLPEGSGVEAGPDRSQATDQAATPTTGSLPPAEVVDRTEDSVVGSTTSATSAPAAATATAEDRPTTTEAPVPTTAPPTPPTSAGTTVQLTTAVPATTTALPTTALPSTTIAPPTSSTTTTPPTTTPPTTTATTTPPTTTATTIPSTTVAPTTTSAPPVADVTIRGLSVGKISSTSAVVSFRTNDCAGARYQVSGGVGPWADGYPNERQCWTDHFAILGSAPFSSGPLEPDRKYTVRITTFAADGSTASARISFRTLELEAIDLPPIAPPTTAED